MGCGGTVGGDLYSLRDYHRDDDARHIHWKISAKVGRPILREYTATGREKTIIFFKIVQNKLLWAISQQTAAELVYRRADATLPLMGMQSYDKGSNAQSEKRMSVLAKIISMKMR